MEKFKNGRLTLRGLLIEVKSMLSKFFSKSRSLDDDEILRIPENLKKTRTKVEKANLLMSIIGIIFSFFLTWTNISIESKMVFLGIALFMLYRGQQVAKEATRLISSTAKENYKLILKDEVALRASEIIGYTSNKVMKNQGNFFQVISDEEVMNSVQNYLSNCWEAVICHKFQIVEIISVFVMLIAAVATNKTIPNEVFIPLITMFTVISFLSSAYVSINGKYYYSENKKYDDKQSIVINDILRVPEVAVGKDVKMRISILQRLLKDSNQNTRKYTKKLNKSNLFVTVLEAISQWGVIIFYLISIPWNSIEVSTISEITANLAIVEVALGHVTHIFHAISEYVGLMNNVEKEEENISQILNVYHAEKNRLTNSKSIGDINIPAFEISYIESSKNDIPFRLTAKETITINEGEIAILYGPSGSGKSTFMNMLAQRVSLNKSEKIPSTSRILFFDEKLKFGSLSLYQEVFCCEERPDHDKMKAILENLYLWDEIGQNCHDIWQWMSERKFNASLSNGQRQRLILAKMLYWLDDNVDVLVLDEPTSGLDETSIEKGSADAVGILEYIVKFANACRKRTVIIATHQNVQSFIKKLEADGYTFNILQFRKSSDANEVVQIT